MFPESCPYISGLLSGCFRNVVRMSPDSLSVLRRNPQHVAKKLKLSYNVVYGNGLSMTANEDELQHSIMEWFDKEGYVEYS